MTTDKQILKQLGERIRLARLDMQLSQEEVSLKSGVALRTITRIEKGEENYNMLNFIAIARALNAISQIEALFPKVLNPLEAYQASQRGGKERVNQFDAPSAPSARRRVKRARRNKPEAQSTKGSIQWGED